MSKEFRIVLGTAQEVSLEITRCQSEGWKIRDGQPVLVQGTSRAIVNEAGIAVVEICEPIFAQTIVKMMSDEDELFKGEARNPSPPESRE